MKFDPAAEWDKLSPEQQRAIGIAALTLQVAGEAIELLSEEIVAHDPSSPERTRLIALCTIWETADQHAWTALSETVPQDADLFDEGPV